MTIALFPGQGVQAPGMDGRLAATAPGPFTVASDVLGVDVAELCRTGSAGEADLGSTRWAQPAVLTCSVAAFTVLSGSGEKIEAVAGHSIGEYAALVAAGVLDIADAVRLVALRAKATEEAALATPGAMAAVMRAERDLVEQMREKRSPVHLGDDLRPLADAGAQPRAEPAGEDRDRYVRERSGMAHALRKTPSGSIR